MEARPDLIHVISSAHSPLPEVVLKNVVGVSKFVGVTLCLGGLSAISAMDLCPVVNVNVIKALRRSESEVVVAWSRCLSETSHWG